MTVMRFGTKSTFLQVVTPDDRCSAEAIMKQRRQSQLATAVRKAMLLSVTGFAGLSVLTSSVTAQDIAPGFTPGSTANQPFALLVCLLGSQPTKGFNDD